MKMFLRKSGMFILLLFLFIALLFECLNYLNRRVLKHYKIDPSVNTIIIGDSHTQWTIDDRHLPNSINISQMAEAYMFSYIKLKSVLENNPQIKTVLLGCSYHNFSSYYDRRIFGHDSVNISSQYYSILPLREQLQVLWNSKKSVFYFRKILRAGIYNVMRGRNNNYYSFMGKFRNAAFNTRVDEQIVQKRINNQYYSNGVQVGFSATNISYLNKIIALCREKSVDLVMLRTPMYAGYRDMVPLKFKNKFNAFINDNDLKLIQFDRMNLPDSCFIPDGDHVSNRGAMITTDSLKNMLERGF